MPTDPGWQKLLAPYIADDVVQPNGDQNLLCPIHGDSRRSATVNFVTNEWYCFACENGGTIEKLIARKAEWFAPGQGPSKTALKVGQRELPDNARLDGWTSALLSNAEMLNWLEHSRGISAETIQRFGLGLNDGWLMIPIIDRDGKLVNIRQYNRNADDGAKVMHWKGWGRPTRLFPMDVLLEDPKEIVICEGELDAIVANQNGLPTITSTGGVKTLAKWNPEWTEWVKGRVVTLCFDCDPIGRKSAKQLADILSPEVKSLKLVRLPYRSNSKKDLTDFFVDGYSAEDLQKHVQTTTQKRNGKRSTRIDYGQLREPSKYRGKSLAVLATPSAVFQSQSMLPSSLTANCEMDWVPQKCKHCPVFATAGKRTVNVEHDDPLWMDLLAGTMTTKARNNMYKDKLKVPATCPQVTISEDDVGVWPCEIRNGSNLAEDATPAVIVLEGNSPVLNQPADLEGSIVTSNRGSRAIFVAHSLTTRKRDLDAFVPDDFEIKKAHALIRSIKGEPHEKLDQMSEMFEKHVTGIFGQRLLHMAIDLVYHSIVQFKVGQFPVPRGWMELLAVGETRSGKSTAATRIKDVLGHGHLVGAENASIAGLLGGLEKSSGGIGGDGYVRRAGTLPLHNRKLIIFDEAQGLQIADISKMSDVRSRGEVQIAKIQHIEAQAQVRLIWLSNPRDGKRHARGIDALQDQMGAPEDLSRVDIPLFIKADVGDAFQKAKNDYGPLPFDTSILEWLVLWAWSRKPEQVVWSPEASDMIWAEANDLAVEYKTEIPIFQHNEAHIRLARLAVALAARLFSTTDGHTLQVNSGHVKSAVQLYSLFLGADSLGIRELKDASDWRKEQGMLSQDELRMIIRGLDPSERQRIRGSISFTQLFPDRDRQLYMQAKLSNSGALYAGRDNDLMFESWFIEMVKEISNELD